MKKWLIAVLVTAVTGSAVIAGNSYYQAQLDTTAREAMHIALTDETGRALGNLSAERFNQMDEQIGGGTAEQGSGGGSPNGDGTSTNSSSGGTDAATDENATSNSSGSSTDSDSSSGGSGSVSASGLSEGDIVDTYFRQFERLQQQEQKRVNELIQDAQEDLSAYRGGNTEKSRSELQVTYVKRVEVLEDEADSRFNKIYRELTTALEENGYDKDVAEEFRAVYESEKESRRLEAINRLFQ